MGKRPAAEAQGKKYRVIGPHPVHGTPSGETFTALLDSGQEDFLVAVGHIEIAGPVTAGSATTDSADGAEEDASDG